MWKAPNGETFREIPQRWVSDGTVKELAGDPRRALRVGWVDDPTIVAPPTEDELHRFAFENAYLEATKALIILAGGTVADGEWPKLEDADFAATQVTALSANIIEATCALNTLQYTYPQILRYGGTWEGITYHS
jgi:hypothetical protein